MPQIRPLLNIVILINTPEDGGVNGGRHRTLSPPLATRKTPSIHESELSNAKISNHIQMCAAKHEAPIHIYRSAAPSNSPWQRTSGTATTMQDTQLTKKKRTKNAIQNTEMYMHVKKGRGWDASKILSTRRETPSPPASARRRQFIAPIILGERSR